MILIGTLEWSISGAPTVAEIERPGEAGFANVCNAYVCIDIFLEFAKLWSARVGILVDPDRIAFA